MSKSLRTHVCSVTHFLKSIKEYKEYKRKAHIYVYLPYLGSTCTRVQPGSLWIYLNKCSRRSVAIFISDKVDGVGCPIRSSKLITAGLPVAWRGRETRFLSHGTSRGWVPAHQKIIPVVTPISWTPAKSRDFHEIRFNHVLKHFNFFYGSASYSTAAAASCGFQQTFPTLLSELKQQYEDRVAWTQET